MRVIRLELSRATDMFQTPEIELGSVGGGFGPGVSRVLAELKARPGLGPPRIEVTLPPEELAVDLADRMIVTLRGYCAERRRIATREREATIRSGLRSFLLGIPVAAVGLAMTTLGVKLGEVDDALRIVTGTVGLVLTWVGLWYPFDKILFYPYDAMRDAQALRQLQQAEIKVTATASARTTPPDPRRG